MTAYSQLLSSVSASKTDNTKSVVRCTVSNQPHRLASSRRQSGTRGDSAEAGLGNTDKRAAERAWNSTRREESIHAAASGINPSASRCFTRRIFSSTWRVERESFSSASEGVFGPGWYAERESFSSASEGVFGPGWCQRSGQEPRRSQRASTGCCYSLSDRKQRAPIGCCYSLGDRKQRARPAAATVAVIGKSPSTTPLLA
jgi:hypothetical protein